MNTSVKVKITVSVILMVVALVALGATLGLVLSPSSPVLAEDEGSTVVADDAQDAAVSDAEEDADKGMIAMAAAIAVGVAAAAGAIAMGIAVSKTNESIARQPEAKADIRSSMMLGLVFIETAIIYALIVAILLIFVL